MKNFLFIAALWAMLASCQKEQIEPVGPAYDIGITKTETFDPFTGETSYVFITNRDYYAELTEINIAASPEDFNQIVACFAYYGIEANPQVIADQMPDRDNRCKTILANRTAGDEGNLIRARKTNGSGQLLASGRWSSQEITTWLLQHYNQPLLPMVTGQSNHPFDFYFSTWNGWNSRDHVTTQDIFNSANATWQAQNNGVVVNSNFEYTSISYEDRLAFDTAIMTNLDSTVTLNGATVGSPGDICFVHYSMIDELDSLDPYGDFGGYDAFQTIRVEIIHGNEVTNIWVDSSI